MSRIGRTIRSAKMKLTTPPKLIPFHAHIHRRVTFHTAGDPLCCLLTGQLDQLRRQREPHQQGQQDHHHDAAEELGRGELPAHHHDQDDPELDHQVGGGELKGDRVGEAGALAEDGAGQGDSRVGARAAGGPEEGRQGQAARGGVAEHPRHGAVGDDRLHDTRQGKAQDEGPEHLSEHTQRDIQRRGDRVQHVHEPGLSPVGAYSR